MQTNWIFFDIGDVLFDEDAQHRYLFHSMLLALRRNGFDVKWDDYFDRLRQLARVNPGNAFADAVTELVAENAEKNGEQNGEQNGEKNGEKKPAKEISKEISKEIIKEARAEYHEMRKPRPYGMLLDDIQPVLADLKQNFRLGIIANQHPPIMDALRDYGVQSLFDVIAIDEIVGFSKPDPRIFTWALEQASAEPGEVIFVGDRPDNDVAPAKALGMGTVRFKRGQLYVHYDPRSDAERADVVVTDVARLAPAIRHLAARRATE